MVEESHSLAYTPTWVVAGVCFVIVLVSLLAERGLHKLGKFLMHTDRDALFEALQKLKEELMLLGFISLLLTAFQGAISRLCIPPHIATKMLPCKRETEASNNETLSHGALHFGRRLLSESSLEAQCTEKGKVPLLSLEALHQLHIFIFVMAVMHVIFCVTTMVLGGTQVKQWKKWEYLVGPTTRGEAPGRQTREHHRHFLKKHAKGYWRSAAVISWLVSFCRQFYDPVTKSDYIALQHGFITTHCPNFPQFDFHGYVMRTLEVDFKKIVGVSWYLWLFVVVFLLLNLDGWHTYFWLAFLPVILLLLVGAKLQHIITLLAQEVAHKTTPDGETARVEPSDKHFWFGEPVLVLHLIHFILFQNSFEIAFFFWILTTYGFRSCMMEKVGFIVTRLIMGVIVQVLCSYSTLPLYVIVSQMGSKFKKGMFDDLVQSGIDIWLEKLRDREEHDDTSEHRMMIMESSQSAAQEMVPIQENSSGIGTNPSPQTQMPSSSPQSFTHC